MTGFSGVTITYPDIFAGFEVDSINTAFSKMVMRIYDKIAKDNGRVTIAVLSFKSTKVPLPLLIAVVIKTKENVRILGRPSEDHMIGISYWCRR